MIPTNKLTAFEQKTAISNKQLRDAVTAVAFCSTSSQAYVCVESGSILVFEIKKFTDVQGNVNFRSTLTHQKKFKRANKVQTMELQQHVRLILILLSGGAYTTLNMDSLEEVKAIKSVTRNADGICLDMPQPHRVAMTSRKHLFFFHWSGSEWKNYDKIDTTGDPINDMCWIQSKLCVGTATGYRLIDPITKAEVKMQIPIGSAWPCLSYAQNELLVQAQPHVGIFINVDALLQQLNGGKSSDQQLMQRSSINWECKVSEVVRCAGYFLGLDENGIIEIVPEDRETDVVQTITESGLLHLIQGDSQIIGYSSTDVYILSPAPLSQRIDECIANVRVEEAFRLIHLVMAF